MTPLCPKCRMPKLKPLTASRELSTLAESLIPPPSRCTDCHGVWLPHEAIHAALLPETTHVVDAGIPVTADNDAKVGFCPAGHGFMRRAAVEAGAHSFHLDRCEACRGVWFDAGEWATIAGSQWLRHLDDLWDPVFRRRLREGHAREHHLATLREALGDDVLAKVITAAEALKDHPMKSVALAYLLEETGSHAPE